MAREKNEPLISLERLVVGGAKFSSSPGVGSSLFRLYSGDAVAGITEAESSKGVDSYSVRGVSGIKGVAPPMTEEEAGVESRSRTIFPPNDLLGLSLGAKSEKPFAALLSPFAFWCTDVDVEVDP